MRFINLDSTARRTGKGQTNKIRFRLSHSDQTADAPTMAFGDGDTGLWESADDVLQFGTAGAAAMTIAADNTVTLAGNLVVSGTQTTVNSTTLTVDDKNLELGSVDTPSDTTADGGGITLKGATDKTFNWVDSTDAWTSSEHINLASGKTFQLNGTAITSTAAELNLLDGVTSTTTELNYTDGVTSAIQTQLNAKAPLASPTFTGNFTSVGIDDNADATAITIDSSERVGIGNTAPSRPLHVYANGSDAAVIRIENGGSHVAGIELCSGHGNWAIHNSDTVGDALEFRDDSAGVTRMMINSSGKVGIGTTAPAADLDFGVTTAGDNIIHLRKNSNSIVGLGVVQWGVKAFGPLDAAASDSLFETGQISTSDGSTYTQKGLKVQHDGKVGIGVTDPDAQLEVNNDSGSVYTGHFKNGNGTAPTLWVEATGNDNNDTGVFKVDVNGSTRFMVSNYDGNVGIGTTTPAYKLVVDGDGSRLAFSAGASYPFMTGWRSNRSGTTCGNMYIETWRGGSTISNALAIEGAAAHITPGADNAQDFGSTSNRWGVFHGRNFQSTPVYSGAATGFPNGATANSEYDITVVDWGAIGGGHFLVKMSWMNHSTTYGYTVQVMATLNNNSPNTSHTHYQGNVHWHKTNIGLNGGSYYGIPCQTAVHTSSTALTVNMYITEEQGYGAGYPPLALMIKTNCSPSTAPQIQIYRINI